MHIGMSDVVEHAVSVAVDEVDHCVASLLAEAAS
jgi:hypothetical protein